MAETAGSLTQRKRDLSMERVLHEARHLFKQKGYCNTTVQELCDRCMLSKTTFFNYFESKAGLVFMIAEEFADKLAAYRDEDLPRCSDPIERIRLAYCFILESLNKYNNLGGVLYQLICEMPARRDILLRFAEEIKPLITQAQRLGALRNDFSADTLNDMLIGLHFTAFYTADADQRIDAFSSGFSALMQAFRA